MTKMTTTNSNKGFKYAIIVLVLIVILTILTQLLSSQLYDSISILIGLLVFGIGIMSLVGFLKGFKDQNKIKKIIGIIVNLAVLGLFISVIIANALDVYQAIYD